MHLGREIKLDPQATLVGRVKKMVRLSARGIGFGRRPAAICHIIGCPRSGTTALGEWLEQQPGIVQMFETRTLIAAHHMLKQISRFERLHRDEKRLLDELRELVLRYHAQSRFIWRKVLIEKEPLEVIAFPDRDYRQYIENVRKLFPDVKLLFIVRDPLATIWSMRNRKWGYSLVAVEPRDYTLEECISIWSDNAEIIAEYSNQPNSYVCKFESLVDDAAESRRITDFLGLPCKTPFQAQPTKIVDFQAAERELILQKTAAGRAQFGY